MTTEQLETLRDISLRRVNEYWPSRYRKALRAAIAELESRNELLAVCKEVDHGWSSLFSDISPDPASMLGRIRTAIANAEKQH